MLIVQLCPTNCDHMDCSLADSSVHRICQARILEWVSGSLLQEIFPIQGLYLGLLHCRQILYDLSHQGSFYNVKTDNKSVNMLTWLLHFRSTTNTKPEPLWRNVKRMSSNLLQWSGTGKVHSLGINRYIICKWLDILRGTQQAFNKWQQIFLFIGQCLCKMKTFSQVSWIKEPVLTLN